MALASVPLPKVAAPKLNRASDLESGNIGKIERTSRYSYTLNLRSDNDQSLPKYWRQWWFTKIENVPTDKSVSIRLKGRGHWNYYVPVYSYDNVRWHQFKEKNVLQPSKHTLVFKNKFKKKTVYLARYYPYTYTKLLNYLDRHKHNPALKMESMGMSRQGFEIPALTITDRDHRTKKGQVIIHARTHPGEVASSYMLEGALSFLLSPAKEARKIRKDLLIRVVPMLNVDGVVVGNNRVTPDGVNLEGKWFTKHQSAKMDYSRAPYEVRLFYKKIKKWMKAGPRVSMALNLHSSNGDPRDKTFFFPHFGPSKFGYSSNESDLWRKQLSFIGHMKRIQGRDWFNKIPSHGRRDFLAREVPESWWWKGHKSRVMALTVEATFGKAGKTQNWIKPNQIRKLGSSMAKAIGKYHGVR